MSLIRPAEARDYQFVKELTEELVKETVYTDLFSSYVLTEELFTSFLLDPFNKIMLICEDKGFVTFETSSWPGNDAKMKFARLSYVYIKPEFRKQGIMEEFLRYFENWAKIVEASHCFIGTNKDMTKHGYVQKEIIYMKEIN